MAEQNPVGLVPRRRRRWWRWALAALVIALAVVWFTRPSWYGVSVVVTRAERGLLIETVVSSGRVLAPARIPIGAALLGTVAAVEVKEGERVTRGQVLVRLEDDEARAAVERAEAALAQIAARKADLQKRRGPTARELLAQARAALAQAEADFARDTSLHADGVLPEADLARARTALELAKSRRRAAEIDARAARADGPEDLALDAEEAQAQATLEGARARLVQHTLSAPVDGLVLAREVEPGGVVQPGATLIDLAEAGDDRLVIEPDERNLRVLAVGQPALASADAFPDRTFDARVAWIASAVDPRRGTVEVHLALRSPQDFLKSDMTVSVEVEVARKDDALTLPRALVRDLTSVEPWVMLAIDGRAVRRPVAVGLRGADAVEILAGLDERDRVIVPDPDLPAEGARVRLAEDGAP